MNWDDDLPTPSLTHDCILKKQPSILSFPIEIISHIMLYLSYGDLCKWKEIDELIPYYNNVYCWALKAQRDYGVPVDRFKETKRNPSDRYLQILSRYGSVKGSEEHIPIWTCTTRSVEKGDVNLVRYFNSQALDYQELHYREQLLRATESGHLLVMKDISTLWMGTISCDIGYDLSLSNKAGQSGNRKIIKFLKTIETYERPGGIYHAMLGFQGALQTGDLKFINYCLIEVKRQSIDELSNTLEAILERNPHFFYDAVIGGNTDIITMMLPYGSASWGLDGAFVSNNLKWIAYFREHGATINYHHIVTAVICGHLNLIREYLPSVTFIVDDLLGSAIQAHQNDVVRYLMTTNPSNVDLKGAITTAISKYNWDAFEYLCSLTSDLPEYNGDFKEVAEYLEIRRLREMKS